MKDLIVKVPKEIITLHLPTTLNEISNTYLTDVTAHINVADNYSLIGIVRHEKLKRLLIDFNQKKKNATTGVIPIFIKAGNTDNAFIKNAKLKDKITITGTQLTLSIHVPTPKNSLSLDKIMNVLTNTTDKDLYNDIVTDSDDREIFAIEFKLVPNADIVAFAGDAQSITNPYIERTPIVEE